LDDPSLFETTAEIAVAFTGFIGIFLVLASREGRFPPSDAVQIRTIVICSIAPVFYAFLPLVLNSLGVSAPVLWRVSSGATLLLANILTFRMLRHDLRVRGPRDDLASVVGWVGGVFANLCWLANVLAWPWAPSGGTYLAAVWLIISIAAVQFVVLIFHRVLTE
jgi:hypothetical protein